MKDVHTHEPIPRAVLALVTQHARIALHVRVLRALKSRGLTTARLARRLQTSTRTMRALLANPSAWSITTAARLLYAITGEQIEDVVTGPVHDAELSE